MNYEHLAYDIIKMFSNNNFLETLHRAPTKISSESEGINFCPDSEPNTDKI